MNRSAISLSQTFHQLQDKVHTKLHADRFPTSKNYFLTYSLYLRYTVVLLEAATAGPLSFLPQPVLKQM